jgi:hypothetical protein
MGKMKIEKKAAQGPEWSACAANDKKEQTPLPALGELTPAGIVSRRIFRRLWHTSRAACRTMNPARPQSLWNWKISEGGNQA